MDAVADVLYGRAPSLTTHVAIDRGADRWQDTASRAIAIVGVGAILPDAPNAPAFWENVQGGPLQHHEVTPERWDPALYYDPDPTAPDKTYSKIGGWVREYEWDPLEWQPADPAAGRRRDGRRARSGPSPARARRCDDYGYPERPLDPERTAVILGNAMAGEKHYLTALRIYFPEYARELAERAELRRAAGGRARGDHRRAARNVDGPRLPEITEDTMPGELANCIAGRIANLFNFHGPNFIVDAACASAHGGDRRRRRGPGRARVRRRRSPAASTATWARRPS